MFSILESTLITLYFVYMFLVISSNIEVKRIVNTERIYGTCMYITHGMKSKHAGKFIFAAHSPAMMAHMYNNYS
jgi:hypothetical protein